MSKKFNELDPAGTLDDSDGLVVGRGDRILRALFNDLFDIFQDRTEYGVAGGYATLDLSGKIPAGQLPDVLAGGLAYQGVWNATTNSPTIPPAVEGNKGWYFKVSTAGSTNINGITDWDVGDWIISNGASWDKIDNTEIVTSVAGKTGDVTLVKADVGLGNVDNTSDLAKPVSTATQTALNLKQSTSAKGQPNGYASLDSNGLVPTSQLPAAVAGGLTFKGTWNAATNVPAIPAAAAGNNGWYYKVATPGATNVDGTANWSVGDWIISNGATWDRIAAADAVLSVAGRTGAVVLSKTDVGLGNVDNTSDANKPVSTAVAAALALKIDVAQRGVADGLAELGSDGKVKASQLPGALVGALVFQGVWNASTNSPAIPAAAAGNKGWYYKVSADGSMNIDGTAEWKVGDWIVSNGLTWDKIDNTEAVSSVNGQTGAVTISKSSLGLGNVDNTTDLGKPISTATQTALDLKANTSTLSGYQATSEKGANNGYAGLGSTGLVPWSQLPKGCAGINTQTASYQLVAADAGKTVSMNVATANNLTVPNNATVPFAVGDTIDVFQYGAGQTTVVAGSGVTIRSSGSKLKLTGQYSGATLQKIATDEWLLVGDIAA